MAATTPRHNLAVRLSAVIGRDELLGVLVWRSSGQRLMTLTGSAGVGKSTMALALAERVLPRYGMAWWVDLATVEAPMEMLRHVTRTLGLEACNNARNWRAVGLHYLLLVLDGADLLFRRLSASGAHAA